MAGIGDLVVNLKANASQFNKEMASAKSSVKGFSGLAVPSFKSVAAAAASMVNPVKIAMAAVASAAVGTGLALYGLNQRIGEIAGLSDKAAQFGVSVKFFQQLEFAADQSGVSSETLAKSVGKLTVAVGNAAAGSDPAIKAFEKLGINVEHLQSLNPEQQFMEVAKAISALPTQADKAAASVAIFGKSGLEMTTLFAGGLNDITALMKEAGALGIGLDDEDVARVAAADDALQRMKSAFTALLDQAIVGLAPTFEDIANTLTGWIAPLTKFLDGFNALENRSKWIRDVLQASMDVAFQHIAVRWDATLEMMAKKAKSFGQGLLKALQGDSSGLNAMMISSSQQQMNERNLGIAERKLDRILRRPGIAAANQNQQAAATPSGVSQNTPGWDMWGGAGKGVGASAATKNTVKQAAQTQVEQSQKQVQSIAPAFATAANRGSSEAYKTILRSQRPEVKAMNSIAVQAALQTVLQRQIATNTTPQFAPEF